MEIHWYKKIMNHYFYEKIIRRFYLAQASVTTLIRIPSTCAKASAQEIRVAPVVSTSSTIIT